MDTILIQKEGSTTTNFIDARGGQLLYSIFDEYQQDGWWSSMIQRMAPEHSEEPIVDLASISYINYSKTTITYGFKTTNLDAVLRRRDAYSNSRSFVGSEGAVYVWSVNGRNLELRLADSHILVARSYPSKQSSLFQPTPRSALIEILPKYGPGSDNRQMLDTIITTYSIMQHKLNDRLKYRFRC